MRILRLKCQKAALLTVICSCYAAAPHRVRRAAEPLCLSVRRTRVWARVQRPGPCRRAACREARETRERGIRSG